MRFDLTNSSTVLQLTLDCAASRLNAHADNNPFDRNSGTTPTQQPTAVNHKAEVTAYLANILSAAGVQGFFVAPQTPPEIAPWEVAWSAPNLIGLARIDDQQTIDGTAILLTAADSSRCKGSFASAKQPSPDGKVLLLKTACKSDQKDQSFRYSYSIVPRAAGGCYITAASETSDEPTQSPSGDIGPRLLQASHNYLESAR
jgi:hypothetical protein